MDIVKFLKSFVYAFKGVGIALGQQNMRVHFLAVFVVFSAGWYFSISQTEWLAIILIVTLVLTLEMVNTAIELTIDLLHPEQHNTAGKVKDLAAGAVLIAAIAALIIAGIIFGDDLLELFKL